MCVTSTRIPSSTIASISAISRQIDHMHDAAHSYDNIAIGTDIDGLIRPTLAGRIDPR